MVPSWDSFLVQLGMLFCMSIAHFVPDTHPAQLILLPFDTIPVQCLEKLTVSFSGFGILSHGCMGDVSRVVVERLRLIYRT